jgi:hypothetical protein
MDYQTFEPHLDLKALINCYWTLEIPKMEETERQRIVPDGMIEMAFILGDDIKRYTGEESFILQPRSMVLGQTIEPFYIEPTGYVNTFAIRFYPYGFANFVTVPIRSLANKETQLEDLFGIETARALEKQIVEAKETVQRIEIVERFFLDKLSDQSVVDSVIKTTVDALLSSKGNTSIKEILKDDLSKRRQLERKFAKQIGVSPKQLMKVIRLQTALKMLLNETGESLTDIAYQSEYYDQAHFIKDFKEFTGVSPRKFLEDEQMVLSSIFYK